MSEYADNIRLFSREVQTTSYGFADDVNELEATTTATAEMRTHTIEIGTMITELVSKMDELINRLEAEKEHSTRTATRMGGRVDETRMLLLKATGMMGNSGNELANDGIEALAGSHRNAGESTDMGVNIPGQVETAIGRVVTAHSTLDSVFFTMAAVKEEIEKIPALASKATEKSKAGMTLGLQAAEKFDDYADNL